MKCIIHFKISTRVSSSASRTWFWVINYDDIIDGIAGFLKQLNQIILIRFWRSVIVQKNINSSICGFGNRKSRCGQIGINQNDYWFHSINMYFLNSFIKIFNLLQLKITMTNENWTNSFEPSVFYVDRTPRSGPDSTQIKSFTNYIIKWDHIITNSLLKILSVILITWRALWISSSVRPIYWRRPSY